MLPPGFVLTAPHEACWSPVSGLSRHVAVVNVHWFVSATVIIRYSLYWTNLIPELGLHIVTRSDPVSKLPDTDPGYRNDTLKTIL